MRYGFGMGIILPDFENYYFFFFPPSISVTGPLSEQQIAYVSRETLQVVCSQVLLVDF